MGRWNLVFVVMGLCAMVAGCQGEKAEEVVVEKPGAIEMSPELPAGNAAEAARANNKFAWGLWGKAAGSGNVMISPVSVSQAMAMTAAGAEGVTGEEIWTALGYAAGENRLADQATLVAALNKAQTQNVQLASANALWVGKNEKLKPSYATLMMAVFAARAESLDFAQAAKAAATINAWVESKTNNKIKNLVPASALGAQTRMVLTNAVYFKADWATQFKKEETRKAPFKVDGKAARDVDMMNAKFHVNYAEDEACQVVDLPYKGNRVVMRVILPKEGSAAVDGARVAALAGKAKSVEVQIGLPRFKVEWEAELSKALKELGIKRAFEDGDFSPMFVSTPAGARTQISAVIHKTYVLVDETGTEAAAATAVVIRMTAMPLEPVVFKADRPFMFQIVDKETGTILFMGRVSDPTK